MRKNISSPENGFTPLTAWLITLFCLALTLTAHAETVRSYPNRPGAMPRTGFASAALLDPAVVVPLIGETRLELPAPTAAALATRAANQIGVAVEVPAEQRGLPGLALDTAWTMIGTRQYARLTLRAAGAASVRAGVTYSDGFPGRVYFISSLGEAESELKRNDGLAWSSTSDGDILTLLVEIPAGYRYRDGDLSVPLISHIDTDPRGDKGNDFANIYPDTASCTIDLACAKSSIPLAAGASTMKIVYTQSGSTYTCSGTLLADSTRSYKPYVYTAQHCIGSQTVADTVVTFWNLQYPSCSIANSGMPAGVVKLSDGAQLLHESLGNDHAFLLLNSPAPTGAVFMGWTSDQMASGTSVVAISHPKGDVKKIAGGAISTPALIFTSYTTGTSHPSAWNVDITQGALQPGSSGGSLLTCDDFGCYLRGSLSGISTTSQACNYPQNIFASRFDIAYPAIKKWLGTPTVTSLMFSGWPTVIPSNTTVPMGKITAEFSNNFEKSVGIPIISSNPELLWFRDGTVFTGTAKVDTLVSLTATYSSDGIPIEARFAIEVKASEIAIKTAPTVVAGDLISMTLKSDNTVWGWGYNSRHAFDDTTARTFLTPVHASYLSGVVGLSAFDQVLALKGDGTVWAWGNNQDGQTRSATYASSVPARVKGISAATAVAAGASHSVALKSDGTVWSWGTNDFGQFGDGTSSTNISPSISQAKGVTNAKVISVYAYYTLALLKDGTVMGWGNNQRGQLGTVTYDLCPYGGSQWNCSKLPVKIPNLDKVISIGTGRDHALALRSDGTVWAWGQNSGGELGDETTTNSRTPKPVPSLSGVIAIAVGSSHNLALKSDGTVWAWGINDKGQLGYSTTDICKGTLFGDRPCSKLPKRVSDLSEVAAISGGSGHSLALKTDGSVWAWGFGYYGQLGNNSQSDSAVPLRVVGPDGKGFLDLGASQIPATTIDTAKTSTALDCLFTWAEKTHPELLAPGGSATGTLGTYRYRSYPATRAYLGWSSGDEHIYYLGPSSFNLLADLGTAAVWYATAGCR